MLALHVPLHGPLPCEDAMRLWSEILQVEDTLFRKIFNHYRPELHYMRGPGPKWLEKHSAVADWRNAATGQARFSTTVADSLNSPGWWESSFAHSKITHGGSSCGKQYWLAPRQR